MLVLYSQLGLKPDCLNVVGFPFNVQFLINLKNGRIGAYKMKSIHIKIHESFKSPDFQVTSSVELSRFCFCLGFFCFVLFL